jgi:hypothetical protein
MGIVDRLNGLDARAARRGWIGRPSPGRSLADENPATMSALWRELNDVPVGWWALTFVALVVVGMISTFVLSFVFPVVLAAWLSYAAARIRRRSR